MMTEYMHKIMDELDRTEEMLYKGLKEINDKGELNAQSLEVLGETLDGVKDLCEIKGKGIQMMDEYGYSERNRDSRGRFSENDGYWHDGRSYNGSYADGRMNNGRSYEGNSYENRRSYADGQSYADDPYLADLHRKMENAKNDTERDVIRNMIMERERSR